MTTKRRNKKSRFLLYFMLYFILLSIIGVAIAYISLPNVERLKGSIKIERKVKKGDRWEKVPFVVGEGNRNFVPLSKISDNLVHAVIVAEDIEFYSHGGFNFNEIAESIKKNVANGSFVRGGSTITQQLMKNIYLSGEKSIFRKIVEAILTYKAEKILTKSRILELYLNVIEWGEEVYGINQASWTYFKKSPSRLNIEEAAYLASLIPAPRKYAKAKPGSKMAYYLKKRQNTILWWMTRAGYISPSSQGTSTGTEVAKDTGSARTYAPKSPPSGDGGEQPPPSRPTITQEEEKELFNMIEEFQPEEVFKETKSFEAPAEKAPVAKDR